MTKINSETKFVKAATFINKKGQKVEMIFQPYCVGIYLAIYEDDRIATQSTISYSKLSKMIKNFENDLKKDFKDVQVHYSSIGSYLTEDNLKFINEQ